MMKRLLCLMLLCLPVRAQAQDKGFDILSQLFTYDVSLPLNVRIQDQFDTVTFHREKLVFDGWRHSRVPAIIAMPKDGNVRHPMVVLIDGIGGWKERWWQSTSWNRGRVLIDSLIAAGYGIAMMDAPLSGERIAENDYVSAEKLLSKPAQLRDLALQNTIEHRRLIDYLVTRSDVDTTCIGALGLSLGGMTVFYLGATEPRVRVAAAGLTPLQKIPDLLVPTHYAARMQVPILLLMGRTDAFYTKEQVDDVFAAIASHDKQLIWYDVGHRLPEQYAGAATAWFRKYLR